MSDTVQVAEQEPETFEELPDAPPKSRLRLSWVGKICVGVVAIWVFLALFGPWITPYGESWFIEEDADGNYFDDPSFMLPNPSVSSYLGTDYLGRDILSRIIWGARTTIGISFASTMLAYFVGITLGIAAAVAGRATDMVLSRLVDAVLAFPNIMLGLIIIAAFGSSIPLLIGLAGLVYAASVFRIARALGQDIMVQDFVEAARARGEGLWWIITREILPNAAMPLATDFGLRLVFVILFISSLSFLGLGVQPPISDWGSMVRENMQGLGNGFSGGALASVAPAIAIATLTIAINLIVDDISAHAGGSLAKKMV
jgi:peptide/nickel transport system permease protein